MEIAKVWFLIVYLGASPGGPSVTIEDMPNREACEAAGKAAVALAAANPVPGVTVAANYACVEALDN